MNIAPIVAPFAVPFAAPFVAVLLAAGPTHAAPPAVAPPAPMTMVATDAMQLELRDSVTVAAAGATAVFSVDSSIAEASVSGGRITIVARGVGATTISVVTATGVSSFQITVIAPPRRGDALAGAGSASRAWTQWQGNYESSSERLTNSLELVDGSDRRTLRGYVVNVTRLDARNDSDADARSSLPALALEWRARRDELVVFDKTIDHSQLTLEGVTVRGVHVRAGGLELHAGVTSPVLYQNVFLSTQREVVLGASYELRAGRSSFTPSVYVYPSTPQTGGTEGSMTSMLYRYATSDDRLQLRGELGWGGKLGAAGELSYHDTTQRAWISARHEPRGFAALGIGRPIGSTVDALWTADPNDRLTLTTTGSAARYDLAQDHHQDVEAVSTDARVKLVPHVAVSAGVSAGRFSGDMADTVRSLTVPLGLHLDGRQFGGSAIYRYQTNSVRNQGGHGGRLSLRANLGAFHATAFGDVQQDAATLELILKNEPALAQLLNEMGLTAQSPEDLARLLRENAQLAQLGYAESATLSFHPWRAQAGGDLAWLAQDESRQQLRLRMLFDRTQEVNGQRDTRSLSLSYARRLGGSVDATAMLSWWSHGDVMGTQSDTWSIAAGLRVRIDDVPHLTSWRRGDIEGVVANDGEGDAPIARIKVRLDGGRTAETDASGHFAFTGVDGGEHRVEAEAPDDAYFTGPSRIPATAGDRVRFGIVRAAAHLGGFVRDDQGAGIAGVSLVLTSPAGSQTVTSDSSGRFRFAVAQGEYVLDPVRETIPAGFDVSAVATQTLQLVAGQPVQSDVVVPANRSIAGTVRGAPAAGGSTTVTVVELGRTAEVDATGRYVFRGLKPGRYTVEVTLDGKTLRRVVELAPGPGAVRDVDFP